MPYSPDETKKLIGAAKHFERLPNYEFIEKLIEQLQGAEEAVVKIKQEQEDSALELTRVKRSLDRTEELYQGAREDLKRFKTPATAPKAKTLRFQPEDIPVIAQAPAKKKSAKKKTDVADTAV